jgi:hypothetical protein
VVGRVWGWDGIGERDTEGIRTEVVLVNKRDKNGQ